MLTTVLSILIVLVVLLLFLAAVLIFRAMMFGRVPEPVEAAEATPLDGQVIAEHLASAIRAQTISTSARDQPAGEAFERLHRLFEDLYPRLHAVLERERVSGYSLLYTWQGRAPELEPVLLCTHMDVVPADPASLAEWSRPPFSGDVADGQVWGRGALDQKSTVIALLETVEGLIRSGYQPERTVYLALGHDEEIGGKNGAGCIAGLLAQRGVRLAAVLDEGSALTAGLMPGVGLPVALVGVAEKGYASVELRVEGRAGHSALPPRHSAIGVLARALTRLEARPMPARMAMARLMFDDLGPFLPFGARLAMANPGLFGGAVRRRFERTPQTDALVRTTMAATLVQGGVKENVLPAAASAVVNCRLLPGDTREKLLAHIRQAVNDDAVQITLSEETSWEASPVSPAGSPVYRSLSQAIRQVFPETIVAPYLVAGATDARYYAPLCGCVYRFSPYRINAELLKTIHGIDERIPVEDLPRMVAFFTVLIKSWTTVVGSAG